MTIGVCLASIPPRSEMLGRCLASIAAQTLQPDQVEVHVDYAGIGSARARNIALERITTEWVAFVDDDDLLYPCHLERLLAASEDADLVYPLWDGPNKGMFWQLGRPWSEVGHLLSKGNWISTTVLARTELVRSVGGFQPMHKGDTYAAADDWWLWLRLLDAGARFTHLPEETFHWSTHDAQTSGRPWRLIVGAK